MEKLRLLRQLASVESYRKIPLVELADDCRILIENHIGVLSYSQAEISVRVSYGYLRVVGRDMKLAEMHRDQLVISGQIDGVFVHRR